MTANKEIESLRSKVEEYAYKINNDTKEKQTIQDDLKNAFMRGLCSMNQDAMNILGFNQNEREEQSTTTTNYSPSYYNSSDNTKRINNIDLQQPNINSPSYNKNNMLLLDNETN
jgi:centrosomal protein POC5